uniref:Reverse transcriptase Ty1/copia-type domain-containing protein n=1 Tax=Tanacetum cinerariifolium TaxID=118510 RepID=A0A6L2M700_TANCI|nr:hypothetical protein [Tanacetum cinerariifolium]
MTKDEAGNEIKVHTVTAQQILARTRERKAKSTLLMAILDEHLARFHGIKDAKTLWAAIKTRFCEGLDKGYDRFQRLLSLLEIHEASVFTEDANQKFLRSLPSAWNNISLIMRNKPGIDNLDIADMYNNLNVYEADIIGSFRSSSNSHNVAFVYAEITSSTNELNVAYSLSTATGHSSQAQCSSSYAYELMFLFFDNQSSSPQLNNEDLEQVNQDDLEEMDLKCKGHFARDCKTARNLGNRSRDAGNASYQIEEEATEFALMAFTSNPSSSSSSNSEFPPPLTGTYMPPKRDISFAGLDDFIYKFKISETVTSLTKDVKDAPDTSTAIVEKPKEVRTSASLIQDWDTDSDNDSVFRPKHILAKIDFVKASEESKPVWNNVQRISHQNKFAPTALFIRSERIPVSVAKPKVAASTSAVKPVNTAGPKQSVNFSKSISTFHKSHSPIRRSFYNATAHSRSNSTERVNTAGLKGVSVVKGNVVIVIKTSACCVWRPRVNAIDQISKDNRWMYTRVDYVDPQGRLKSGTKPILPIIKRLIMEVLLLLVQVEGNLVKGLPSKIFENDHSSVACQKGKQHKATCKGNQTNKNAGPQDTYGYTCTQDNVDTRTEVSDQHYLMLPLWFSISSTYKSSDDKPEDDKPTMILEKEASAAADALRKEFQQGCMDQIGATKAGSNNSFDTLIHSVGTEADFNNMESSTVAIRTKWVYKNKKDDRGIVVRNKDRLVAPGHIQENRIDYDEVFPPVARIEAIRIFLAFTSYMKFIVYQMNMRQDKEGIFISQDKYVAEILIKFDISFVRIASTPIETQKPLVIDKEAADVDVYLYRSMLGSLMYLTASRLDIMFAVYAYSRFQVTPKLSHLQVVKRIFRYLKGQPKLGIWYPRDSPFDLECKKQTIVATSTTEAEYVTAANYYG